MHKAQLFALSFLIIVTFSCSEENPTEASYNTGTREVHTIGINGNNENKILTFQEPVFNVNYMNGNTLIYTVFFNDNGYIRDKIVIYDFERSRQIFSYYTNSLIENLRTYPENSSIVFETNGEIYIIETDTEKIENVTNTIDKYEKSSIYLADEKILIYSSNYQDGSAIILQNLVSGERQSLLENNKKLYYPLFVTKDKDHLVFFELNPPTMKGLLNSFVISNPDQVQTYDMIEFNSIFNMNISDNDIITYSDAGDIITLDLNTSTLRSIGIGQLASISKDGERVAFIRDSELYLVNYDGSNLKQLVPPRSGYLFYPTFALSGEKIMFVESEVPLFQP